MSDIKFFKSDLEKKMASYSGKDCEECKKPLSFSVYEYAVKNFGRLLCMSHQQALREQKGING